MRHNKQLLAQLQGRLKDKFSTLSNLVELKNKLESAQEVFGKLQKENKEIHGLRQEHDSLVA